MDRPPPWRSNRRRPLLYRRERRLLFWVFALLLLGFAASDRADRPDLASLAGALLAGVVVAVALFLVFERYWWRLWHAFANAHAEKLHLVLLRPEVVDGDTVDDLASGVRYRFANIDAPETGENAQCAIEAQRGRLATLAAIAMVRRAKVVSVRRTWRIDIYGRRIAFVYADGIDIGERLVAKGFARPWRGRREDWCGRNGGLARIGRTGAMPVSCKMCGAWSPR